MKTTLIITCQDRFHHLQRMLEGVSRNTVIPDEILIVCNDVELQDLTLDLNIQLVRFPYVGFPIGKNRNLGAANAQNELLFFLDVDCIPAPTYFETMLADFHKNKGLLMGNPKYLSQKVKEKFSFDSLSLDAIQHPYRPVIDTYQKEDDYAIFWSLCFVISKSDFTKIGGFDPKFKGYGAEDTDFAFTARQVGLPFHLSPAEVYHQQHPIYRPPVNHLHDIVYNSNVFYQKWNQWPMGGWLKDFQKRGWIKWNPDSAQDIQIIHHPTKNELELFRQKDARFV